MSARMACFIDRAGVSGGPEADVVSDVITLNVGVRTLTPSTSRSSTRGGTGGGYPWAPRRRPAFTMSAMRKPHTTMTARQMAMPSAGLGIDAVMP